jgi:hypothetical protein
MTDDGRALTTHWRTLYENKYLGAWNLWRDGKYTSVTITIDRVMQATTVMEGGRKTLNLLAYFVGKRTPLIVTKKMGKVISAMYGPVPATWPGKSITLYVEQGYPTRDGPADVLRIRNTNAGASLKRRLTMRDEDDGSPAEPVEIESFGGEDDAAPKP